MRRNYFIVIIIVSAVIIAIVVSPQFFDEPNEKQNILTPALSEPVASFFKLEPQTNSEGLVTVFAAPRKSANAGTWEFEITLDTHSVELDSDLTKTAILIADDKEYQPIAWDGNPPGGHHRNGILRFAPISPQPKSIVLKVFRVGGIAERNFIWQLK